MKKIFTAILSSFMVLSIAACGNADSNAGTMAAPSSEQTTLKESASSEANTTAAEVHDLELSDMVVKITSAGYTATFQLYDTTAAAEFYEQLPLELELSNFSDAQWMFYPPEKLNVTENEVYHDGKKGELSYYEPWGDVFMLYEDFYAGDDMHRLGIGLSGIDDIASMSGNAVIEQEELSQNAASEEETAEEETAEEETAMQIQVEANGNTIVFELNDSKASQDLYNQLPLSIEVENYSNNEKIFYPPETLDVSDAPQADSMVGTLAYYEPWGDVVMFYGEFGSASGLYELGQAISGSELIEGISGTVEITAAD